MPINSCCVIGNACVNPEVNTTQSGREVCKFSIAVNDAYNKDHTNFFSVVCWGKTAVNTALYVQKGDPIAISGRLNSRTYEDKQRQKRTAIEIVADTVQFLAKREKKQSDAPEGFTELPEDETLPF